MCAKPNLDDAEACLARAHQHYRELSELAGADKLWGLSEGRDRETGEWFNCLHLDGGRLVAAKPVLADSATNAWSALDQLAAAIARANGRKREDNKRLLFPRGYSDKAFNKGLAEIKPDLGGEMTGVLTKAREKHSLEINHLEAARQISNSGKHWELATTAGTAKAVSLIAPGDGDRMFDLPADVFATSNAHEFYRGQERLPRGNYLFAVNLLVSGLDDGLPDAANSILECSFRFVRGVIDAVAEARADDRRALG